MQQERQIETARALENKFKLITTQRKTFSHIETKQVTQTKQQNKLKGMIYWSAHTVSKRQIGKDQKKAESVGGRYERRKESFHF